MATTAAWFKVETENSGRTLQEARDLLERANGEVVLDFSAARRISPSVLNGLEEIAGVAERKGVKVVLRHANVEIYKVLKLVGLASRFSFLN